MQRVDRWNLGAAAVREANDLTNELLTSNAKNLRESNKMIREEMERGVFDIEAVKQANADLIGTINESLQIADEGKARRAAAEAELQKMEAELRDTLASAKARRDGVGAGRCGVCARHSHLHCRARWPCFLPGSRSLRRGGTSNP